jgi:hypothetical protein
LILPSGITGCWGLNDEKPPQTDIRAFHSHCFEVARRLEGRVLSVVNPNPDGRYCNYAIGTMKLRSEKVCVVLNAHYPIMAIAQPRSEQEIRLRFQDNLELAMAFGAFEAYLILLAQELEQAPTTDVLHALSPAEQKQVKYWNPQRLGDLIFNEWD